MYDYLIKRYVEKINENDIKNFAYQNGIELKCRLGYTITQFNKRTALEYIDESIANMMLDHKYLEE